MLEGIASLQELETYYSIDDLADRNDALDALADARAAAERSNRRGSR